MLVIKTGEKICRLKGKSIATCLNIRLPKTYHLWKVGQDLISFHVNQDQTAEALVLGSRLSATL